MAKAYHHLAGVQRYWIEILIACQWLQSRTAQHLNVSKSTVSRELKRNRTANQLYDAVATHSRRRNGKPRLSHRRTCMMQTHGARADEILAQEPWNPKQIAGHLRHKDELEISISGFIHMYGPLRFAILKSVDKGRSIANMYSVSG